MLRQRITDQVLNAGDAVADASARAFRLANVERAMAAARDLPDTTLVLRSDEQTAEELADAVLAHLSR